MKNVTIFLAAFIFGVGLAISGMTNPEAIISFLDIFGDWNPALALVMVGAIGVNTLAILFIKKQKRPIFETDFSWPAIKSVDKGLLQDNYVWPWLGTWWFLSRSRYRLSSILRLFYYNIYCGYAGGVCST